MKTEVTYTFEPLLNLYDLLIRALLASRREIMRHSTARGEAIDIPTDRFCRALKKLRKDVGLSQRTLAGRAHTTAGYIAILETGRKKHPSRKVLRRLTKILGGPWRDR
jgi:predicted transcriptional regulator